MPTTILSNQKIVSIASLSEKGRGKSQDGKIEVIGGLPGEEVLIELGSKRGKRQQGYLRQVVNPSSERVTPLCPHVPECGGCAFQHMEYAAQLAYKEKYINKYFAAFIQQHEVEVRPILGCENPWRYRNKMEFSFSENKAGEKFLGLMLAGSRGRVLNLSECYLTSKWFTQVLDQVRTWWGSEQLQAYYHHKDAGHLRTLTLRESVQGKGKMVILTVSGNPEFSMTQNQLNSFLACIKAATPNENLSVFLQIHQIKKGSPSQFFEMLLFGPDHITEKLHVTLEEQVHCLEFKISPTSFFQPNTLQAERLYSEALQMVSNLRASLVFDLYCGGATIGLSAAKIAKRVVGIELNHYSVFDAGWNQEVNGIKNFSIHRGDVGEVLTSMKQDPTFVAPDVIIIDPPRCGLDAKALENLKNLAPKEILYISCNPKTQAANVEFLIKAGYRLKIIQPVDQFPHTVHIENICFLQKT